jgi:hypothetical protein
MTARKRYLLKWGCDGITKSSLFVNNMKVYTFVDNREIDRYEAFKLFKNRKDAEDMRTSMKDDKKYYDVHEVEVLE